MRINQHPQQFGRIYELSLPTNRPASDLTYMQGVLFNKENLEAAQGGEKLPQLVHNLRQRYWYRARQVVDEHHETNQPALWLEATLNDTLYGFSDVDAYTIMMYIVDRYVALSEEARGAGLPDNFKKRVKTRLDAALENKEDPHDALATILSEYSDTAAPWTVYTKPQYTEPLVVFDQEAVNALATQHLALVGAGRSLAGLDVTEQSQSIPVLRIDSEEEDQFVQTHHRKKGGP